MLSLSGCHYAPVIDRAALDAQYEQTALAEGVLSSVPRKVEHAEPPTVVNWWYAGSRMRWHYLVFRELTWDAQGEPAGRERWYRVPKDALPIDSEFARVRNDARWVPLYEAAAEITPPADLVTTRQTPGTVRPNPVEPEQIDPQDRSPQPIAPPAD